jgi:putative intracellular protease/amidase
MAEANYVDEEVVVSRNFVTARGWGDMGPFFKAFIAQLG